MQITIDLSDPRPVYEQIVGGIETGVQQGELSPGTRLPSIRQLAADLEINPNTVARAYQILEANRVVKTLGRRGTVIDDAGQERVDRTRELRAEEKLRDVISTLQSFGLGVTEINRAFANALEASFAQGGNRS